VIALYALFKVIWSGIKMIDSREQERRDHHWMKHALNLARQAEELGEVPVGAVLIEHDPVELSDKLLAEGFNQVISLHDSTAHAEINAIRKACKAVKNYRLPNTTLYITLEPCAMCAGAIIHSRISRVVIATQEPRAGAAGSVFNVLENEQLNHHCDVHFGIMQKDSSDMLKAFFKERRNKNRKIDSSSE